MFRLMALPHVARFPEATVTRDSEKMSIRFGGLGDEQVMEVSFKYLGAKDEETLELRLIAQLQHIG